MRRLILPLIAFAMLLTTSAASPPENWRQLYKLQRDVNVSRIIWDLDSANARLNLLLEQMQHEGQISKKAVKRIQAEIEQIEFEYLDSHFSILDFAPSGMQKSSDYSFNYRKGAREYEYLVKPADVQPQLALPPAPKLIFPPAPIKFSVSKQ